MAMKKRIQVVGNGNQAHYGIGEIIAVYHNTPLGLKKAMRCAAFWYNPALVIGVDGERIPIDYDVVRPQDCGYIVS